MAEDKAALSAEDLALVKDADTGGSDAKPEPAAKGKAAGEKAVADKTAKAGDKARAPAEKAEADDSSDADDGVDDTEQAARSKAASRDESWLSDDDGDDADAAAEADGAASATDGKKAADKAAADWRDEFTKAATERWLKKAKSDDDKKAIASKAEGLKKQLARYGSLEAAAIAGMEAQEKLRAGTKSAKPGKEAAPEEHAQWREEQGLPKAPDEIVIPPVQITGLDGRRTTHKWTDRDQPLIDSFREVAFELDMPQDSVNKLTNWFVNGGMTAHKWEIEAKGALDKTGRKSVRDHFREEFGDEAAARMNMIPRFLNDTGPKAAFPAEVADKLWSARTENGELLIYDPVFAQYLAQQAWDHYGDGEMMVGDRKVVASNRLAEITQIMKNDFDRYLREGLDKEYTVLLEKEEGKAGRRGRAA